MAKIFMSTAKIGMGFLYDQDEVFCCSVAAESCIPMVVEAAIMFKLTNTDALFVIAVAAFVGGCVIWALGKWIGVIV
jgi:hypothetical protein